MNTHDTHNTHDAHDAMLQHVDARARARHDVIDACEQYTQCEIVDDDIIHACVVLRDTITRTHDTHNDTHDDERMLFVLRSIDFNTLCDDAIDMLHHACFINDALYHETISR
jgi:hypothetical protein